MLLIVFIRLYIVRLYCKISKKLLVFIIPGCNPCELNMCEDMDAILSVLCVIILKVENAQEFLI